MQFYNVSGAFRSTVGYGAFVRRAGQLTLQSAATDYANGTSSELGKLWASGGQCEGKSSVNGPQAYGLSGETERTKQEWKKSAKETLNVSYESLPQMKFRTNGSRLVTMSGLPLVYFAGPDVFRPDAKDYFDLLCAMCERFELQALLPSDGTMPSSCSDEEVAQAIYRENMRQLRQADGVIANLEPFRGLEPDSGTAFEVGVAIALGLPVVAYGLPTKTYAERVSAVCKTVRATDGTLRDPSYRLVEDLGLPINLMLARSVKRAENAEEALKVMGSIFAAASHTNKIRR